MKRLFFITLCLVLPLCGMYAQGDRNSSGDNIIGKYMVVHDVEKSKVEVTKQPDGTYKAQIYWVENAYDKNGKKRVDEKNPDKTLRNVPCDRIVLFWDLRYNPDKARWDKGKVYDPTRGLKVNLTSNFDKNGNLLIKGSLMGISETVVWKPISE